MEFSLDKKQFLQDISLEELDINGGDWGSAVANGLGVAAVTAAGGAKWGGRIGLVGGPQGAIIGAAAGAVVGGVWGYYSN
ncbi:MULTISPECIES: bacteriocin, lactobin A family protein [Bacillus cereus group]|uniref:bacteriocin, lactobin A family protein n=1 Tax=Bacillus cereus group TaxID=86661 RepID=UPI000BFD8E19|nr:MULTISPECIES: bacteriocin, lactobin A family protein [Bacillus cereus group]MBJ8205606.1 bacteriocin, lactobin A family protein [Bacillus cereus]PGM97562.1 bacteriocin, lactobin A family protein [Bacillus cereus]